MITEQELEDRGYRRCDQQCFPHADFFMQRKVTDPYGIRYFIEFVHYPRPLEGWMCQLNIDEPHCTFEQHRPTDLDMAENRCCAVWGLLGRSYYERYEPEPTTPIANRHEA